MSFCTTCSKEIKEYDSFSLIRRRNFTTQIEHFCSYKCTNKYTQSILTYVKKRNRELRAKEISDGKSDKEE